MSRDHKKPMLAFVVVAIACAVLVVNAARSSAADLLRGPMPSVAAAQVWRLLPGADHVLSRDPFGAAREPAVASPATPGLSRSSTGARAGDPTSTSTGGRDRHADTGSSGQPGAGPHHHPYHPAGAGHGTHGVPGSAAAGHPATATDDPQGPAGPLAEPTGDQAGQDEAGQEHAGQDQAGQEHSGQEHTAQGQAGHGPDSGFAEQPPPATGADEGPTQRHPRGSDGRRHEGRDGRDRAAEHDRSAEHRSSRSEDGHRGHRR